MKKNEGLNKQIGEYVIIRTCSAGVWFGKLIEKSGQEVYLEDARRMSYWRCIKGISLSGISQFGVNDNSEICYPVKRQWLVAIEILDMTDEAIKTLKDIKSYEPK